jgi:hypothetical protein
VLSRTANLGDAGDLAVRHLAAGDHADARCPEELLTSAWPIDSSTSSG